MRWLRTYTPDSLRRSPEKMGTMVYEALGALQVVVHAAVAPSDDEWARYLSDYAAFAAHQSDVRGLIVTDGGAPKSNQRATFTRLLDGRRVRAALVTRSVIVRSAMRAINLFNPDLHAFAPEIWRDAFAYVGVRQFEQRDVITVLTRLSRQLPDAALVREVLNSAKHASVATRLGY